MPNYCSNEIVVTGRSPEDIDMFLEFLAKGKSPFDFNLFTPYPAQFAKLDAIAQELRDNGVRWDKIPKDGYNQGGYEWCIEHWGTKWNSISPTVQKTDNKRVVIGFDTAWSPCQPIIVKMAEFFPALSFYVNYSEPGIGFEGEAEFHDGECSFWREWDTEEYGYEEEDEGDE